MTDPSVDRLLKGEPVWERMKRGSTRPVIFLPHYGEFGFFILQYIRFIHFFNARDKVVCCAPGSELYFPTAHDFYYEWTNPIPDSDRCVMACGSAPGSEEENKYRDAHLRLGERLRDEYPDHEQIEVAMVCRNPAFARLNFGLVARDLTCVDIAIGARHREWDRANNYPLWPEMWDRLLGCGLSVGVVGSPESTVRLPENVVRSWHHVHGVGAGAVAMLRGCRLYVGTDTGVSHLAAMLSTPSLVFRSPKAATDMTFMLRNATTGWFQMLGTEPWGDPDVLYNRVRDALQAPDLDGRFSYPLLSDPNAPLSSEGDTRRSLFPTVDRSASSDVYALTAVDELSPLLCHWIVHYLRTIQVQRVFLLLADPIADEAAAVALRAFGDLVTPIRCYCDRFDDVAKQQAESDLLTSGVIADNAWIIYADIDELVQFPAPLRAVTAAAQKKSIDWIGGTFVDRLSADGRLGAVRAGVEWQDDFPIKCHLTSSLLSGDDRKIVLCRAWVRCFNSGHHTAVNGRGGVPIDGDYEVHHFKWTVGLLDRIKARLRSGRYSEMYLRECEIVVRTFDSGRGVDVSNLRIDGRRP